MFGSLFGNGSWQNHWLAIVLVLAVIGVLIFFGLKSGGGAAVDSVSTPSAQPTAPATKKPSGDKDKKDTKKDDKNKKDTKKDGNKPKYSSDDRTYQNTPPKTKDSFANWGATAPEPLMTASRLSVTAW